MDSSTSVPSRNRGGIYIISWNDGSERELIGSDIGSSFEQFGQWVIGFSLVKQGADGGGDNKGTAIVKFPWLIDPRCYDERRVGARVLPSSRKAPGAPLL